MAAENLDQNGYIVQIDHHVDDSTYASEQYGEWEEHCSNYFRKITRKTRDDRQWSDVTSTLDLKAGDEVFVVWLEYSTGDSFGYSYRGGREVLAIFNNAEDARLFANFIKNPIYSDDPEKKFAGMTFHLAPFESSDGQVIEIYAGTWTGYFEHLEEVHIEHTAISYA